MHASKKLKSDELLLAGFAGTRLRMELDRVPLWRGDHVAIKQLAEDFPRYAYLPRLRDSSVLTGSIADGLRLLRERPAGASQATPVSAGQSCPTRALE